MQKEEIEKIINTPFFFIIGRPRSGTTLLRTMFDAHPNVCIPLENSNLIYLQKKYYPNTKWSRHKIDAFINDFFTDYIKSQWRINKQDLETDLSVFENTETCFENIIKVSYSHYLSAFNKEGIKLIGDKSPINSLYMLKLYKKAFNNAKFIFLTRDPRDNIISIIRKRKYYGTKAILANYWEKSVKQYLSLKKIAPDKIIHIKYEKLLLQTEDELKRLCEFLSIPYSKSMLEFHTKTQAYSTNYIQKWESTLFKPINKSHINLWKKQMKKTDVKKIEYHCGRTLNLFKYEKTNASYSMVYHFLRIPAFLGIAYQNLSRHIFDSLPEKLRKKVAKRKFILSREIKKIVQSKNKSE